MDTRVVSVTSAASSCLPPLTLAHHTPGHLTTTMATRDQTSPETAQSSPNVTLTIRLIMQGKVSNKQVCLTLG